MVANFTLRRLKENNLFKVEITNRVSGVFSSAGQFKSGSVQMYNQRQRRSPAVAFFQSSFFIRNDISSLYTKLEELPEIICLGLT